MHEIHILRKSYDSISLTKGSNSFDVPSELQNKTIIGIIAKGGYYTFPSGALDANGNYDIEYASRIQIINNKVQLIVGAPYSNYGITIIYFYL